MRGAVWGSGIVGTTKVMTDETHEDVTDVLAEDEVVHVPTGVEELVESHELTSIYVPEVPDWEPASGSTPNGDG